MNHITSESWWGFPMDGTLIQTTHSLLGHIIHYSWDCILDGQGHIIHYSWDCILDQVQLFHACRAISHVLILDFGRNYGVTWYNISSFVAGIFGSLCAQQHEQQKLIGLCTICCFFFFFFQVAPQPESLPIQLFQTYF